jgi:hypothetical protein
LRHLQDAAPVDHVGELTEPNRSDEQRKQLRERQQPDYERGAGDLVRLETQRNKRELAANERHGLSDVVPPERRRLLQWCGVRKDSHRGTLRERRAQVSAS